VTRSDVDLLAPPTHALILAVVQELPSPDHQQSDVLDDVGIELGFELGRALLVFQNAELIKDLAEAYRLHFLRALEAFFATTFCAFLATSAFVAFVAAFRLAKCFSVARSTTSTT
jgi:hypothetical protein